jgi:hypothetical protein
VKKFVVGGIEKAVGMRQSASPFFVQLIARLERMQQQSTGASDSLQWRNRHLGLI